ncbi:MAG TPA: (Fe-S)-binding protein, partial [bacterium]|nr:(Fe-S)-binding protein [bacterium]
MPAPLASIPKEVYFFGTCLVDLFYPQAGLAAVELLERQGVRVIFPPGQTCCGQPPFNSGYREEALAVACRQLALFSKPIPVVVPS